MDKMICDALLAEAAFGEFDISPKISKSIAERTFEIIETGSWTPLRRRLIESVLDGFYSDVLRRSVQEKVQQWFPNRFSWRSGVYEAIEKWPATKETFQILWRGLHDEKEGNKRAAANALAKVFAGDAETLERLLILIRTPIDTSITTAALEALTLGWQDAGGINKFIEDATQSQNHNLRLVGLRGKILKGLHMDKDKEALLILAKDNYDIDYDRREDLIDALIKGWPRDEDIKKTCLENWRHQYMAGAIASDIAGPVLLIGYPGDSDVISALVNLFTMENYPHHYFRNAWNALIAGFKGSQQLSTAIEFWLDKRKYFDYQAAYAAVAAGTPKAKKWLINKLETSNIRDFWIVWALLEGWGMDDSDVAEKLTALARGNAAETESIAHHLPKILSNHEECRERLLEIVKNTNIKRLDFVMKGIVQLGADHMDREILDAILQHDLKVDWISRSTAVGLLIQHFSKDERVHNIALNEIARRNGTIEAVALTYADDEEMRKAVSDALFTLPSEFRQLLIENVGDAAKEDEFVYNLLSRYDEDTDGAVKTLASIKYHESLLANVEKTGSAVDRLQDDLRAVGFDLEDRRQAALAGLLALDRLDIMVDLKGIGDELVDAHVFQEIRPNAPLMRYLVRYWHRLEKGFGSEIWSRLSWHETQRFVKLAPYSDKHSPFTDAMIAYVRGLESTAVIEAEILGALAQISPRSELLLNTCLQVLRNTTSNVIKKSDEFLSLNKASALVTAAEILGAQFGGNETIGREITALVVDERLNPGPLIALCDGWPESLILDEVFQRLKEKSEKLLIPASIRIVCVKSDSGVVIKNLDRIVNTSTGYVWDFLPRCISPLIRRIRKDNKVLSDVHTWLNEKPTASAKASLPKLLLAAVGQSDELRTWCRTELIRQYQTLTIPECGLDMMTGRIRPVAHALLDVLKPI